MLEQETPNLKVKLQSQKLNQVQWVNTGGGNGYYTHISNDFLPSLAVQILCLYFQTLNNKNIVAASKIFKG